MIVRDSLIKLHALFSVLNKRPRQIWNLLIPIRRQTTSSKPLCVWTEFDTLKPILQGSHSILGFLKRIALLP